VGFILKILQWARIPVPFKITTTCGQQKTLPWIKASYLESPYTTFGVIARMALEILFFRSLFRNTESSLKPGPKLVYGANKFLWLGGLAFHYSFLIILIRHYKFFVEPVPSFIGWVEGLDSILQVGLPLIYITDALIVIALTYLFFRRVVNPQLRYLSLAADYFPLILIFGIASTGICMRYFAKTDIISVKELATGLVSFHPVVPDGISSVFYMHLFLVSVLIAYFPFSKLMHLGGVFLSPTRNMKNDNRMHRHVNPWNYPVKTHSYEEYEEEFREKMRSAGLPLDKE
jgi:nitrate reductase gamma subunit